MNLAILCKCFPSQEALLCAILVRACVAYSSNWAAWVYVTPACLPSQMARSFIGISNRGWVPGSYMAWIESHISLPLGAGSSLAFTREAHWPASLNSCKMHCLTITPLVEVMALSHIQMSTLDVLSEPSSSCWMVVGTPSGLYCCQDSIAAILVGVLSWILKHCGLLDLDTSCTHHMSVCMSCMHHTGAIFSMTSAISMKKWSTVGHRSNH